MLPHTCNASVSGKSWGWCWGKREGLTSKVARSRLQSLSLSDTGMVWWASRSAQLQVSNCFSFGLWLCFACVIGYHCHLLFVKVRRYMLSVETHENCCMTIRQAELGRASLISDLPSEDDLCPGQICIVLHRQDSQKLNSSQPSKGCDEGPCYWREVPVKGQRRGILALNRHFKACPGPRAAQQGHSDFSLLFWRTSCSPTIPMQKHHLYCLCSLKEAIQTFLKFERLQIQDVYTAALVSFWNL